MGRVQKLTNLERNTRSSELDVRVAQVYTLTFNYKAQVRFPVSW
jgi:hypothetical protein